MRQSILEKLHNKYIFSRKIMSWKFISKYNKIKEIKNIEIILSIKNIGKIK